jgi:hypothetical protein
LGDLHSIATTIRVVMPHTLKWLADEHISLGQQLERFESTKTADGTAFTAGTAHEVAEILNCVRNMEKLRGNRIPQTLQKSPFIQIFSEFDAFVGALLKSIYAQKQDLLKGISWELSFGDLLKHSDLSSVKAEMLDKEIESTRRGWYMR